eukprot:1145188-Pelagomonas_calceolata.AAC.3
MQHRDKAMCPLPCHEQGSKFAQHVIALVGVEQLAACLPQHAKTPCSGSQQCMAQARKEQAGGRLTNLA